MVREIGSPIPVVLIGQLYFSFLFLGEDYGTHKALVLVTHKRGICFQGLSRCLIGVALYKYPNIIVTQKLLKISHNIVVFIFG